MTGFSVSRQTDHTSTPARLRRWSLRETGDSSNRMLERIAEWTALFHQELWRSLSETNQFFSRQTDHTSTPARLRRWSFRESGGDSSNRMLQTMVEWTALFHLGDRYLRLISSVGR
ncbi:hypothetical protein CEXT_468741 [Caerostris extrusa]|uniref:Uncharacterized protein n=1 Tax=Caerostris extrusa TaxID=172846 RepID=A0AAV4P2N6_CAEEX|nr:hypothetical protein CEXT_468741 [Caerostris extrusa]